MIVYFIIIKNKLPGRRAYTNRKQKCKRLLQKYTRLLKWKVKLIKTTRLFNKYRLVTLTEVTKFVIYRGPVGPKVNNQLNNQLSFNMQGN